MNGRSLKYFAIFFPIAMIIGSVILYRVIPDTSGKAVQVSGMQYWQPPEIDLLPPGPETDEIRYGKELIVHTSKYFGPKGMISRASNGLECQNCHLDGGTRHNGNSFGAVASTYPKYRDRSGKNETIEYRINECMERSLNGRTIDSTGKEMKAMVAYLKWIGSNVPKGVKLPGTGVTELKYLNRAADPEKGRIVYITHCRTCHGANGEGQLNFDSTGYLYPPLWGKNSYNVSSGLFRLTRLAGFVKYNMPHTPTETLPVLSDEEAWDVAAFVNSQPHPEVFFDYDWKISGNKPVDYPFGPYTDSFSAIQHKYGPFHLMKRKK